MGMQKTQKNMKFMKGNVKMTNNKYWLYLEARGINMEDEILSPMEHFEVFQESIKRISKKDCYRQFYEEIEKIVDEDMIGLLGKIAKLYAEGRKEKYETMA